MFVRSFLFLLLSVFLLSSPAKADTNANKALTFETFMDVLAEKYPANPLMPKDAKSMSKKQVFTAVAANMAAKGIHYLDGVKGYSPISRKDFINLTYAFITGKQGNSYIENKLFLKEKGVINKNDIGVIKSFEGDVVTYHENSKEPIRITGAESIFYKDTAETTEDSKIEFEFDDLSVLTIGEDTVIEIGQVIYDPVKNTREVLIKLHDGKVKAKVSKIEDSKTNFNIQTPTAVIGVRGTEFVAGFDKNTNSTNVVVISGFVAVAPFVPQPPSGGDNPPPPSGENPPPGTGVPVVDPATGQPVVDPATGQPIMAPMPGMPMVDPATGVPMAPPPGTPPMPGMPMTGPMPGMPPMGNAPVLVGANSSAMVSMAGMIEMPKMSPAQMQQIQQEMQIQNPEMRVPNGFVSMNEAQQTVNAPVFAQTMGAFMPGMMPGNQPPPGGVMIDPATGLPMIDPVTGQPIMAPAPGMGVPMIDPATGMPMIDPVTGQPIMAPMPSMPMIDPATGMPMIDPATGQPVMAPMPGMPMSGPMQNMPMIDPATGMPMTGMMQNMPMFDPMMGSMTGMPMFDPMMGMMGMGMPMFDPMMGMMGSMYGMQMFDPMMGSMTGMPMSGPMQNMPMIDPATGMPMPNAPMSGMPMFDPMMGSMGGMPMFDPMMMGMMGMMQMYDPMFNPMMSGGYIDPAIAALYNSGTGGTTQTAEQVIATSTMATALAFAAIANTPDPVLVDPSRLVPLMQNDVNGITTGPDSYAGFMTAPGEINAGAYNPAAYTYGLQVGNYINGGAYSRILSDYGLAYAVQVEEDVVNRKALSEIRTNASAGIQTTIDTLLNTGTLRERDAWFTSNNDARSGRVVLDSSGNWVRAQQYVVRPTATKVEVVDINLRASTGLSVLNWTTTFAGSVLPSDLRTLPWADWMATLGTGTALTINSPNATYPTNMSVTISNSSTNQVITESRNLAAPSAGTQSITGQSLTVNGTTFAFAADTVTNNTYTIASLANPNNPTGFQYQINDVGTQKQLNVSFYVIGNGPASGTTGLVTGHGAVTYKDIWAALGTAIVSTGATAVAPTIGGNNLEIVINNNTGTALISSPLDIIYIPLGSMTWY